MMHGYAGSVLLCDLSTQQTKEIPTSHYAQAYLGGRGFAARLYWEQNTPDFAALDGDNPLIITTGPLTGFMGLAGSRWEICAKSPAINPESFSYSNLGGSWGANLKFTGYDGLIIKGVAEKPIYLIIHDGLCEFRDASHLWGQGAIETRENIQSELGSDARALTIGPAGENLVHFASLLADYDASGSCGFGAVLGAKKLKAVVVVGANRPKPADPTKLQQLTNFLREIKKRRMPEAPSPRPGLKVHRQACFGCIVGCQRSIFENTNGQKGKALCGSGFFYEPRTRSYYGKRNDVFFLANRLCDEYGLDANVIESIIVLLSRTYKAGILTEQLSGLPLSKIGSLEFVEELMQKITKREGFGDTLAKGTQQTAQALGTQAVKLLGDYIFFDDTSVGYCPRMYATNALLYAMEPRQSFPQVGEVGGTVWRWLEWVNGTKNPEIDDKDLRFISQHFWGSEDAADFSTYRSKALAAKRIQDRHYAKESAILCNFSWHISSIELFRPEIVTEILSAVTGNQYDENDLYKLGERFFNLERAIHLRERKLGREGDLVPEFWYTIPVTESFMNPKLLVPGPGGQPVSREGAVLDINQFELMKDEYYQLRGWDVATGLPKEVEFNGLGLADVAQELKRMSLTC